MTQAAVTSMLTPETGLAHYLEEIRRFPMLEPQEEYMLAKSWREHSDHDAAHRLVTSHLRLVAKIAMGYRCYGLPISEMISEGSAGLRPRLGSARVGCSKFRRSCRSQCRSCSRAARR